MQEASAASASLAEQAQRLEQAVSVFRLRDEQRLRRPQPALASAPRSEPLKRPPEARAAAAGSAPARRPAETASASDDWEEF